MLACSVTSSLLNLICEKYLLHNISGLGSWVWANAMKNVETGILPVSPTDKEEEILLQIQ